MLKNLLTIILTGVYLFISMPTTSAVGKISLAHQTLLEEVSEHVSAQLNPNQTDIQRSTKVHKIHLKFVPNASKSIQKYILNSFCTERP